MVWETSSGNICVTRRGSAIDNLRSDVNNQSKAIPDNSRKFLIFFSNEENRNFQASRNTAGHDAKPAREEIGFMELIWISHWVNISERNKSSLKKYIEIYLACHFPNQPGQMGHKLPN